MTDGGGSNEPNVDAAREAMRRVYELLGQDPGAGVDQIRAVEGYRDIPESVQRAIEGLSLGERLLVHRLFSDLMEAGFYVQGGFNAVFGY